MTDTDRTLLEKAARAAGIAIEFIDTVDDMMRSRQSLAYVRNAGPRNKRLSDCELWNPLTDDGDALRLLTKLRFSLIPIEGGGWDVHRYDPESCIETLLGTDNDPKRAIVKAAAASLGEQHDSRSA